MIPEGEAWHIRGLAVTHRGPYADASSLWRSSCYGRRLDCGMILDARWVPGPAPGESEECRLCAAKGV